MTLRRAIDELIAVKTRDGFRPKYVTSLRQYLNMFARGRESMLIGEVDQKCVEAFYAGRNEAPGTRASNLGRIASLLAFAERRRWIPENFVRRMDKKRIDHKAPRILTPDEAAKLLRECRRRSPTLLPSLALGMFAGIRPDELKRLDWSNVNLTDATVRIDEHVSKIRRRRWVNLQPVCVEWLRLHLEPRGPVGLCSITERRHRRKLRGVMGWKNWPQDVLRHTAASYSLAVVKDAGKVAMQLGNSPGILLKHYHNLVTDADAERFWKLTPEAVA
ncbi:MAG: hypothetical protein EBS05_26590 [Proteobacteria bacterium]|nr:hypothetical protein [Pseudomonadota bacterium]